MSKFDVQPFISYDDWKALGPMGRMRATLGATEREGIYDNNIYDGGASDRVEAERPYQAHVYLGGSNRVLGNPNRSASMDEFSLEQSQYFHIMETLSRRDAKAMKMVVEAARTGNKVAVEAALIDGGKSFGPSYAEAAQNLTDRFGSGKNGKGRQTRATLTNDQIDQAASALVSSGGMAVKASPNFSVIASSAGEARVLRAFIDTCLSVYPPETQFEGQKLPRAAEEVDFDKIVKQFQKTGRPDRFAGSREDGRLVIGLFASAGREQDAAAWVNRYPQNDTATKKRNEFAPMKNALLWKTLNEVDGTRHYRVKAYDSTGRKKSDAIEQVVNASGVVTVFWSGDHNDEAFMAAAYAARTGKLGKAYGPDGKEMDVYQMAVEAKAAHMSKAEFARSQTLPAFEIPVDAPEGRLALSLVHSDKDGSISPTDMNKIAQLGMTLNELNDMASTEGGRDQLVRDYRVSGAAATLLGDDKVMASARTSYLRIRDHMASNNVQLIGPDAYPAPLLASGDMPPFLFVQGDVEALKAKTLVGITGENEGKDVLRSLVASRAAPAIAKLASGPATLVEMESDAGISVPVNGPHVLVISGGHGHVAGKDPAATLARRMEVIEKGGVIVSRMPPEETSSFYHVAAKEQRSVPSSANPMTDRAAARLVGAMSHGLLLTQMSDHDLSPARVAVLAHMNAGRRPAVLNHGDLVDFREVAGNRAMLGKRGSEAFARAGFLEADAKPLQARFEGARLGLDVGTDPAKGMENFVRHLNGEEIQVAAKAKARASRQDQL